jgi:hypothetical protein
VASWNRIADRCEIAATTAKIKIAKTKLAPHKILSTEYRRARFWDGASDNVFPAAFLPLFAPFLS